jgi:hypothetical protein
MAAFDPATLDRWRALAIVDREGTTVGTISEFYLDRETGQPTWALVDTGLFGQTQTFVPLVHATEISDGLQVPYDKDHIKNTPRVDLHDELTPQEEAELFAHYGVEYEPSAEAATDAADAGSDAESVTTGSSTVEGDEGPGPVRADPGLAGSTADAGHGAPPRAVPAEPGSVDRSGSVDSEPPATETTETTATWSEPAPGGASDIVPDEPGTAEPDEARQADSARPGDPERSGSGAGRSAEAGSRRFGTSSFRSEAEPVEDRTDAGYAPSQAGDHDPDLARTAPVEPGLPGSTAASPYGPTPTVDKAASPSDASAEATPSAPEEASWVPGSAGGFEEQEPFDRPRGSTDRWREAKLAAERERIAREAAEPEERSPLERARRRLERLVGGGQDHHDDTSAADREAAERARRARLGMDDDDYRRR